MDVAQGWSLFRLAKSGAQVLAGENPLGFAVGTTLYVKKWVDSANAHVLDNIRKREGCPHVIMLQGSPPTPTAVLYVAQEGGVAWLTDESSLWFWHKDTTFKPHVFKSAFIQGPRGVKMVSPQEYDRAVPVPSAGYGCSVCKKINELRNPF